ncbi:glycosyltransferase family 2 protein, partial [Peribacillus simplex]|uniref:glycosyltransferase family 2 protein n=1 Tax=Peribacillus simplex TaxID=1478 RepID=UPI0010BE7BFB
MGNFLPISVVIPCYNCKETIERAVNSIWSQTQKPFEVILVEDRTPDNGETLKVLEIIRENYQDGWIKIIPLKKNAGPGNARNVGWDETTQKYVAFLDADDSWHPQKLEIQYTIMQANPSLVLSGHLTELYVEGKEKEQFEVTEIEYKDPNRLRFLLSNNYPTRSIIVKREIPYRFDPNKRFSEDYLLWAQIFLNGNKICLIEKPLAYAYKDGFGIGGLTGQLWKMQKGEIETYKRLKKQDLI